MRLFLSRALPALTQLGVAGVPLTANQTEAERLSVVAGTLASSALLRGEHVVDVRLELVDQGGGAVLVQVGDDRPGWVRIQGR